MAVMDFKSFYRGISNRHGRKSKKSPVLLIMLKNQIHIEGMAKKNLVVLPANAFDQVKWKQKKE